MLKSKLLAPQNVFGDKAFKEVNKLKEVISIGPNVI
jgi:hypothetical protein